jgi:voltage-gated potassium channel
MLTTVELMLKPVTLLGKFVAILTLYVGMGTALYTATAFASLIIETRTNMIIRGLKGGIIRMRKEKNHVIICGYGMIGRYTLENLKKDTKKYIIIDKDPQVVQRLLDKGESVIQGDALDPHILERANIKTAKTLVACLGENSDNIYLVMTASDLNPQLTIAAKASDEEAVSRLHKVGAQIVVMPEVVGGKQLANAINEMSKAGELSTISSIRR